MVAFPCIPHTHTHTRARTYYIKEFSLWDVMSLGNRLFYIPPKYPIMFCLLRSVDNYQAPFSLLLF